MKETACTRTAIFLHWLSALFVIYQLTSGFWMVSAIKISHLRMIAWRVYQTHKSIGISLLLLWFVRVAWRTTHPPPNHQHLLKKWEHYAATTVHYTLYLLLIFTPLTGWLMTSTSPLKIPTLLFGWLYWPHIPWESQIITRQSLYLASKALHQSAAWLIAGLITLHASAALKHHFIDKSSILTSILPRIRP